MQVILKMVSNYCDIINAIYKEGHIYRWDLLNMRSQNPILMGAGA